MSAFIFWWGEEKLKKNKMPPLFFLPDTRAGMQLLIVGAIVHHAKPRPLNKIHDRNLLHYVAGFLAIPSRRAQQRIKQPEG